MLLIVAHELNGAAKFNYFDCVTTDHSHSRVTLMQIENVKIIFSELLPFFWMAEMAKGFVALLTWLNFPNVL